MERIRPQLKTLLKIVGFAVITAVAQTSCYAALSAHQSTKQLSEDEQFVFVMLPSKSLEAELADPSTDPVKTREIRSIYPVSGLYSNQQPPTLIWEYTGGYNPYTASISSDGKYAVLHGAFLDYSVPLPFHEVARFLVDGKTVARPSYNEITSDFYIGLRRNLLGVDFVGGTSAYLNNENSTFVVNTNLHEEIVFDLKTGAVVHYYDPFRIPMCIAIFTVILAISAAVWRFCRRRALSLSKTSSEGNYAKLGQS